MTCYKVPRELHTKDQVISLPPFSASLGCRAFASTKVSILTVMNHWCEQQLNEITKRISYIAA